MIFFAIYFIGLCAVIYWNNRFEIFDCVHEDLNVVIYIFWPIAIPIVLSVWAGKKARKK